MELIFEDEETAQTKPQLQFVPELKFDERYYTQPTQAQPPARPVDPLERYQGNITHEQILQDDELFNKYVREPYMVRFGKANRNRWLLDQNLDENATKEQMLEEFINYQRSFAGGQTLTTASEVTFMQSATEEDKAVVGRGYMLFDKMPNIFSEDTSWGEMFDGMKDYTRAAVVDPTTVLGLGVGRAIGATGTKASATAIRMAAKAAAKNALTQGATREAAELAMRQTARKAMMYTGAKNAASLAAIDLPAAIGADLGYQYSLIEGGAQDEYSPSQTAVAALGTMALPAIVGAFKGVKALTQSNMAQGTAFEAYRDITKNLRGQMTQQNIQNAVLAKLDMKMIEQRLGKSVADIVSDPKLAGDWQQGIADGTLVGQALGGVDIQRSEVNALSVLLDGTKTTDGLTTILKDAGLVYVPRFPGDTQSNFMGDIIANVPQDFLDNALKGTGSKIEGLTSKQLGDYYKLRANLAGAELGRKNVFRRAGTMSEYLGAAKGAGNKPAEQKERLLYFQSVWKRLVTAHPGTTGLNVKGWTVTSGLNTLSDIVESINPVSGASLQDRRGTFLGAIRRGVATVNWLETAEQADNFFKVNPEVEEKLFRFVSGGIDEGDVLGIYGLDKNSKWNQNVEKTTELLQNITGVRIQDEITKKISFMSALDQEIMRKYGYGYNKFFERKDAYVTLFSPEMEDVVNKAIERTMRETYSKAYSQNSSGKGIARHLAREVERISNTPGIGMLLPFGQFLNNALNVVSDYSGISMMYHLSKRAYGHGGGSVAVDFSEETLPRLMAQASVGWGLTLGYFLPKELEKIDKGLRWNEEETSTGTTLDTTYDAPYPFFAIMGRIVAHRVRDEEVPPELRDEAFNLFIGQTTRELGQAGAGATEFIKNIFALAAEDIMGATGEALKAMGSQVVSGLTRPLDPINQFTILVNDGYEPLDRRQGIKAWNEATRYVDAVLPSTSKEIRQYPTTETPKQDLGRVLGGMREAMPSSPMNSMLASVGRSPWNAVKWDGDYPQLKNRLDGMIEPIINRKAQEALSKYDFFNMTLIQKEKIVSGILESSKEEVRKILATGSDRDKMLNRLNTIYTSYGQRDVSRAMKRLGIEDVKLEDIAVMPDGLQKLELIIEVLQNSDAYIDLDTP